MHKSPPKARFIAASYDVMTTPLARMLNTILKLIKSELKARDRVHFNHHGVKRCWFINGFDEATRWLRAFDRASDKSTHSLNTYDFATMYTTLDQMSIVESLHYAFTEAFGRPDDTLEQPCHKFVRYKGPTLDAEWHNDADLGAATHELYTVRDLTRLVYILVTNTYIHNSNHIRRQTKGLPMGTNPAPSLADLTCYAFEAKAMDNLMITDINAARAFVGTFRYIDDIFSGDNHDFEHYVQLVNHAPPTHQAIYPPYLQLNKTTDSRDTVDFLGMTISNKTRSFHITITNTKQRFPVPKINYPSLQGNFPGPSGYGVVTGQLHRLAHICTTADDFTHAAATLYKTLLTKSYTHKRLMDTFKSFIYTHNPYKTHTTHIIRALHESVK